MDGDRFDQLARLLGRGVHRRAAVAALAALAAVGVGEATAKSKHKRHGRAGGNPPGGPGGNSACAHFCAAVFGADTPAAGQCTSDAAKGNANGVCARCGTAVPTDICCPRNSAGFCPDVATATCPNLQTDVQNCGACGKVCLSPLNGTATCDKGQCGFTCKAGFTACGNACVNTDTSDANCGRCGHVCPSGQTCGGGNPGTPGVCGCTPQCAGKCHGVSDRCGGTCDTCPDDQTCLGNGTCVLACQRPGDCPGDCVGCSQVPGGGICHGAGVGGFPCDPTAPASCPQGQVCLGGACAFACTT